MPCPYVAPYIWSMCPLPLLAALLLLAAPATAQRLEPGARVRIHPPCELAQPCDHMIGELQRLDANTATIRDSVGTVRTVALASDTRIDLSRGFRKRIPEGIGLGVLAGAVLSSLGGGRNSGSYNTGGGGSPYFVVLGGAFGGLIGSTVRVEVWLPLPERTFTLVPLRSGVGLGMRVGI